MNNEPWISARSVFVIMVFFGCFNLYTMRMNLSVAIVAMVEPPEHAENLSVFDTGCSASDTNNSHQELHFFINRKINLNSAVGTRHKWDENTQGFVLGSFFYGYIILQFPGGYLADRFGGKFLYGFGMFMTSVLTILSPFAANYHYLAFAAVRFTMGLCTGYAFPCIQSMITKWVPDNEVGTAITASGAGCFLGIVVSNFLAGYLCESTFLEGWPACFYVFGIIGLIWCIFWHLLIYNSPESHPRITKSERDFILENRSYNSSMKHLKTPWKAIFLSVPIWAAFTTQWAHQLVGYLLCSDIPKYMDSILNVSLMQNAVFNAAPNLIGGLVCMVSGYAADLIVQRNFSTVTKTRKFMDFTSAVFPAVCFCLISIWPCDKTVIVALLMIATITSAPSSAGVHCCYVGMAPAYAGTIYGVSNMLANTTGFIVPQFVGWLTEDHNNVYNWAIVFYTSSAISVVFAIFYLFFGSADLQPWANPDEEVLPKSRKSSTISTKS